MKLPRDEDFLPRSLSLDEEAAPHQQTSHVLRCNASMDTALSGRWGFVLRAVGQSDAIEASDRERGDLNRLSLWACVRGLEAIDGSADVLLISDSAYVVRSMSRSLNRWRRNDFAWEHFGHSVAIQNADLWKRVSRALEFHHVEACLWRTHRVGREHSGTADSNRQPQTPVANVASVISDMAGDMADPRSADSLDSPVLRVDRSHSGPPVPAAPRSPKARRRNYRRWTVEDLQFASDNATHGLVAS